MIFLYYNFCVYILWQSMGEWGKRKDRFYSSLPAPSTRYFWDKSQANGIENEPPKSSWTSNLLKLVLELIKIIIFLHLLIWFSMFFSHAFYYYYYYYCFFYSQKELSFAKPYLQFFLKKATNRLVIDLPFYILLKYLFFLIKKLWFSGVLEDPNDWIKNILLSNPSTLSWRTSLLYRN